MILKLDFSSLQKLELPAFAGNVIEIVEQHDPEVLKIVDVFEMLCARQPEMQLLTVRLGPSPITEELTPLRQKRQMYASAIVFRMGMIVKEDMNTKSPTVRDAKILVNRYLHNLSGSKNEKQINEKINQFFKEMEVDAKLLAAFVEFGLSEDLGLLKIAHSQVSHLLIKRLAVKSARTKMTTAEIGEIVSQSVKDLFKQIEVAKLKNKEVDYATVIHELNNLIVEYKQLVKNRKMLNKRKADLLKANEIEKGSNSEANNLDESTMMMLNQDVDATPAGNGLVVETEEQKAQKKAAASSTKSLQLPRVNDEA
ncbi:MAG: hypothetical protein ACOH2V_13210 [Candidatus Saccharimonadaceae bacterium]